MVLFEQDDEWQDGRRYFRPETMALVDVVAEPEEVGSALWAPHGELNDLHTRTTRCYGTCWDLTAALQGAERHSYRTVT
jgi:hypothetical protein